MYSVELYSRRTPCVPCGWDDARVRQARHFGIDRIDCVKNSEAMRCHRGIAGMGQLYAPLQSLDPFIPLINQILEEDNTNGH